MTEEEKEEREETVDEEQQEQEEDDDEEEFLYCPRDIYGNPIDEPPPEPITDEAEIIVEIMNETI